MRLAALLVGGVAIFIAISPPARTMDVVIMLALVSAGLLALGAFASERRHKR